MKTSDLKSLSIADLKKELDTLKKTQFGLRLRQRMQQLENTSKIRVIRRDVARIKTFIHQKI